MRDAQLKAQLCVSYRVLRHYRWPGIESEVGQESRKKLVSELEGVGV
jgi:hypothetical protein